MKNTGNNVWTTYWFAINDENSNLCGEEFFTELQNADKNAHIAYAQSIFPGEILTCYGRLSETEAAAMGLDTY